MQNLSNNSEKLPMANSVFDFPDSPFHRRCVAKPEWGMHDICFRLPTR
jgi:hypothetical protein